MRGLGPKGPLFVTKWFKSGILTGELGPKGPLSGVPHPPKIKSGYGPAFISKLDSSVVESSLRNPWIGGSNPETILPFQYHVE